MPLPKPKEPEYHIGNYVLGICCGVFVISILIWLNSNSLSDSWMVGFAIHGIIIPIVGCVSTIISMRRDHVTKEMGIFGLGFFFLGGFVAWVMIYLFAVGTAQV